MNDTIKNYLVFITVCVVFLALFVKPLALICAGLFYAVIKYLNYCEKLSKEQEADSHTAGDSAPKEASTMGSDTTEETPEKEEFISQKEIDMLLNGIEEDVFVVKDSL